jgi:hypothetical protein
MHKLAVTDVVQPGTGIDPGNPQFSEVPFSCFPVSEGVHQGLVNGISGGPKQFAASSSKSFCQLQYFLAASSGFKSSFYSHFLYLLNSKKQPGAGK